MDNEIYSFALKNTLNELRNVCPDINSTFVFRENGEIIAGDENTPEKTITHVTDTIDDTFNKAEAIGGVEGVTLEADNGGVNVRRVDDFYVVTVTSKKADMKLVNTATRVLVPTVLKLLEKISPASLKNYSASTEIPMVEEPEEPTDESTEKLYEEATEREIEEPEEPTDESTEKLYEEATEREIEEPEEPKPMRPEPPENQLIIENLGGLLVPSDTVRVDKVTIGQWEELHKDGKIEEVEIETFNGNVTHSKIKPIKDSKYEGKEIIRMPDKIQDKLDVKKGELVKVRPILE
jgi:predicted regulator of Ras-like GTPase activity (Roadblock/LC7/MglB family)